MGCHGCIRSLALVMLPSLRQTPGYAAEDGGALTWGDSCATSGHTSNDKCGANISPLDNLGIKSPRPAIIRGRMNDT